MVYKYCFNCGAVVLEICLNNNYVKSEFIVES